MAQYPRAYTQMNAKAIILGRQSTINARYSGSITSGMLEADTMTKVGIGSSDTNRKIRIYSEGGLIIMGDTLVRGYVIADSHITPSDEKIKR